MANVVKISGGLNLDKAFVKVVYRRNIFEHSSGLMFRSKKWFSGKVMVFVFEKPMRVPIHMLFVFFPIDVVWLDSSKKIIDLKKDVRPFLPFLDHLGLASYLVELPEGTISKFGLKKGSILEFDD